MVRLNKFSSLVECVDFSYLSGATVGCLFYVFTVMPSKIKMQTSQYRKSRIWEMKEDKYTKSLAKNQVCAIIDMRDIRKKRFTQIYKALYGDAMMVSL